MNESNSVKEDVDLVREVESLKNENKALTGKITDLELTLVKKKREAKTLLENSEKQKESLLELVSE